MTQGGVRASARAPFSRPNYGGSLPLVRPLLRMLAKETVASSSIPSPPKNHGGEIGAQLQ